MATGTANQKPMGAKAADRRVQDPAGAHLLDRAVVLQKPGDRLQAVARPGHGHRGQGALRNQAIRYAGGDHRLQHGKNPGGLEGL